MKGQQQDSERQRKDSSKTAKRQQQGIATNRALDDRDFLFSAWQLIPEGSGFGSERAWKGSERLTPGHSKQAAPQCTAPAAEQWQVSNGGRSV